MVAAALDESSRRAWAYETPLSEVARIKDHVAFYQDNITVSLGLAPCLGRLAPERGARIGTVGKEAEDVGG